MLRALLLVLMGFPVVAGDLAFVTSQNGNAVTVVDLGRGAILAQADIPGAPAPVAYDPATGRAYVIAADTGRLHVLDEAARPGGAAEVAARIASLSPRERQVLELLTAGKSNKQIARDLGLG